ncbi:MAG TPA: hypothetical protein VGM12_15425 [Trebonia sp.]
MSASVAPFARPVPPESASVAPFARPAAHEPAVTSSSRLAAAEPAGVSPAVRPAPCEPAVTSSSRPAPLSAELRGYPAWPRDLEVVRRTAPGRRHVMLINHGAPSVTVFIGDLAVEVPGGDVRVIPG